MIHGTRLMAAIALAFVAIFSVPGASAETIVVKYRGPVDLARMSCEAITRSSFINRLCLRRRSTRRYLLSLLRRARRGSRQLARRRLNGPVLQRRNQGPLRLPPRPRTRLLSERSHGRELNVRAQPVMQMSGPPSRSPVPQ
jgi:hypothetical protein